LFGGTGQLGGVLMRMLEEGGHQVDLIGRSVPDPALRWDGRTDGDWMAAVDGADAVVNLAGRSVNCRYHWRNLNQMMQSRIDSCEAVGRAIASAKQPPPVWVQASTATIYAHHFGEPFTEANGVLGGREDDVPPYWAYSVAIARAWEYALGAAQTPHTRRVALRTGFTMSPDPGGIFDWMVWVARIGFGGPFAGGRQYVSWITGRDWARALLFCIEHEGLEGPVNLTAPNPLPHRDFMAQIAQELGVPLRLPIAAWMGWLGAFPLQTDIELMLKSRRVVPAKLLEAGFTFEHTHWDAACASLVARWRAAR
jgi:uncharacterized protein (TIGR01777 family)